MDIVLDSNIIINDYLFKSNEFEVVFDHLARTRGKIILPQIVFDEVLEHHKRELESRQNEIKRAIAKLNNVISDQKSRLDIQQKRLSAGTFK